MSLSLQATKADGYYQPQDYDPRRHGTLNKIHGTHRLGHRAAKIREGIIVIRFEMPWKCWCLGCNSLIAKGVRFNAEKKKVGMFYSTPILEFSMVCYWCPQRLVIRTDPENAEYVCVDGCRKKIENYTTEQVEGIHFRTEEELIELEKDPLLRMEVGEEDRIRAESEESRLTRLMELEGTRGQEDHTWNKRLRADFRKSRPLAETPESLRRKRNFALPIPNAPVSETAVASFVEAQSEAQVTTTRASSTRALRSSIFSKTRKEGRSASSDAAPLRTKKELHKAKLITALKARMTKR